ncbi:hypothetical protein SUGI_1035160 [Cryptomeria japonica]|nr:hypothetical protein SUGI_1035160 [Cryptomeria japonica]
MILPSVICDHRWSVYNNASTYTEGSTYSTNLDRVINDLSRNAPLSSGCRSCLFQARQALEQCCSSRQGAQAMSVSCTLRFEIYPFVESGNLSSSPSPSPEASSPPPTTSHTSSLPVALGPSEPTSQGKSKKSSKTLPIVLGLVIGVVLVLLICLIAMRKRVKSAIFGRPITTATHNEDRHAFSPQSGLHQQEQCFIFSLEELAESTENFHDNNKLGEGVFGSVYGTTKDGKQIAVKKLSAKSRQGKEEFMNEVKLMANVQHLNLVKLFGCCVEGDERLIVYEYLPNKSLDTFLFDPKKRRLLDWEKRYNIIIGVARGLLYLHEDSQMKIIHKDIKANNILLDDKLHPKIADFGLAKLFGEDESYVQTRVADT